MQSLNQSVAHSNPFLSVETSFPLGLKRAFLSVVQADALCSPHWWKNSLAIGDTQDKEGNRDSNTAFVIPSPVFLSMTLWKPHAKPLQAPYFFCHFAPALSCISA